jgi:hypothetical protein
VASVETTQSVLKVTGADKVGSSVSDAVGTGVSVGAGVFVDVGKGVSEGTAVATIVGVGNGAAIVPQADMPIESKSSIAIRPCFFFII